MVKWIFTNKYFYIGLLSLVLLGAGFLFLLDTIIMPSYTNYNEGITVPDVTQISLEEAQTTLSHYGLRVEVTERRANSAYPANYVIDQTPTAARIVKPNRKIYLTVNTAIRPKVMVPNVLNLSLRNAEIQLQNYGLKIGSKNYESSRFKNTILRQSVSEGSMVEKGTTIDLVISDGLGEKKVEIPSILGLRLPEAQLKIREAGLRVGPIRFQPEKNVSPNIVLDYSPRVDEITEGETLSLVISERFDAVEQNEEGAVIIDSTGNNEENPPD